MGDEQGKLFVLSPVQFKTEKYKPNECSNENSIKSVSEYNSLKFCRTCANSDCNFVPIFQNEGLKYDLSKKIDKYLPIEVSEEDDLPLQLCQNCASTLIAWEALVRGCIEAENKLLSLKASFKNQKEFENHEYLVCNNDSEDEVVQTKKGNDYLDKLNEKVSYEEKNDDHHNLPCPQQDVKRESVKESLVGSGSSCDEFPDSFDEFGERTEEIQSEPNNFNPVEGIIFGKVSKESESAINREKRIFKCDFCKKVFNRRFNFERHLAIHSGVVTTCNTCGKQYKRQSLLDKHVKIVHEQVKISSLSCSYCSKVFSSSQSLEDHFRTHTGERPFMCEICGKDFRARPNLIAHKKIHTGDLPFSCKICPYRCRLKSSFVDHCQRHEGTRSCLCSVCGKGFVNNYDLTKHKKTHSKERTHSCGFCNLSFVMKRYLKVHMKTHGPKSEAPK